MQTTTTDNRTTSFTAQEDVGTPPSLKAFGGAYIFLWLGMLALVYLARRKQVQLKGRLSELERLLDARR